MCKIYKVNLFMFFCFFFNVCQFVRPLCLLYAHKMLFSCATFEQFVILVIKNIKILREIAFII